MLFHIYADSKQEGYYINEPQGVYRAMLDADWVMYILLPILLIAIVVALMYAWRLHEIPKHKAAHKKMRQAELVSALTILGLFEHWVWVIALFIAYMDWDAVDDWVLSIVRRSRESLIKSPIAIAEALAPAVELEAPVVVAVLNNAAVDTTPIPTVRDQELRP
ncbi:hypothetical protein D3C84_383270 [compost metagenome]|jgi:hypothetical protein